jgi:hypothetical protein
MISHYMHQYKFSATTRGVSSSFYWISFAIYMYDFDIYIYI